MPKVVRTQDWENVFRDEVSDLAKGWNVKEKRGKVFLRIRTDELTTTAYLPFAWQKDQKSMGHSLESHHRNYPYSSKGTTRDAFKAARERST